MTDAGGFCLVGQEVGYVAEITDERASVRFFDGPGDLRIESVPSNKIRPYVLPQQTRVWVEEESRWRIGRVVSPPDGIADFYVIALPGSEGRLLSAAGFHVVSAGRPADPLKILASKVAADSFFFERRTQFVTEMLRLSAAAEGLDGILSSSIRFHRHQISAARQVLTDPTRRYLLADEVGLGKTIEAGMIIRQTMLDAPGTQVLALVPDPLAVQWADELERKFRVDTLNGGTFTISTHDELRRSLPSNSEVDLLVVDEAHQLTQDPFDAATYSRLAEMATYSSALLLLSATPVRSNELAFLRLLHLLDPDAYRLDDVEGFRARVAHRDAVSNAVGLLGDTTYDFLVREGSEVLAERFPEDDHLQGLLSELNDALDKEDEEAIRLLAPRTKSYVSDTYRLHRRMIRTRRNSRIQLEFPVRERTRHPAWLVRVSDPSRSLIMDVLDELRLEFAAMDPTLAGELLRFLGPRLMASVEALDPVIDCLTTSDTDDLTEAEVDLLTQRVNPTKRQELSDRLKSVRSAVVGSEIRFDAAASWVRPHIDKRKLAICTSYGPTARALADHLEDVLGNHRVARLIQGMQQSVMNTDVERARFDSQCTVLVCDSVAEEGWNLQFVDQVLHFDLPWSANRVEQRLGRFDRYLSDFAKSHPVASCVLTDEEQNDRISGTWRRYLDEAVDVFQRSAATLQYVLPGVESEMLDRIINEGFGGVVTSLAELNGRLLDERRAIENQDVFDSLEDTVEGERFFEELLSRDDRPNAIGSVVTNWIGDSLQFTVKRSGSSVRFGVSTHKPPLLPEPTIRRIGTENFGVPYAFDRWEADRCAMARPGDPLIDGILRSSLEDDRGLVFARVRHIQGLNVDMPTRPVFRFHFVLGPDPEALKHAGAMTSSARLRQAMRYLPPSMEEIWIDLSPRPFTQELIEELKSAKSRSLSKNPGLWDQLVEGMDWPATCRQAHERARRELLEGETRIRRIAKGLDRLDREYEERRSQAILRSRSLGEVAILDQLDDDHQAVVASITKPVARLDACGVILVAPLIPSP